MSLVIICVALFIIGAVMGSFACCQAWRLRFLEQGKGALGQWSVCLHCHRRLSWYENIPLVSWLVQRGRCRHCGQPIGWAELWAELGCGAAFGLAGWYFVRAYHLSFAGLHLLPLIMLLVLLVALTCMCLLFVYDAKWGRMPLRVLAILNLAALAYAVLMLVYRQPADLPGAVLNIIASVGILAGIYYILYVGSRERLVGGGDWLLALAIALLLGDWWLALLTLFLANLLGSVVMLPVTMLAQRKSAKRALKVRVPMGPFLIIAGYVVYLLQGTLLVLHP